MAALALVGCSSRQGSDWGEVYSMGTRLLSFEHSRVAMKQAAAIPYASIGVSIDGGSEGMLVLATDNGHEQLWTSASHMALLIRNGRIVRSAGLDHDLTDARLISGDAELSTTAAGSSRWELDFADLGLMSIPVDCTSVVRGPASVQNFNVKIQTIRVDENCHSSEIDWDFTNSYWISPATGIVWHAIQYVNPKLGPIETEILRQPGR
ncbi:MAG TPA: YjbF family lipoprotein [Rhizomicrobium sp.]